MATVVLQWTTAKVTVPANTDLMQYKASIDGVADQFVAFGTLSAQFDNVAPGDYVALVALSNGDGSHLENQASAKFTVPAPTVDLDAPDVITVSIS